jgi:hypothetical protein
MSASVLEIVTILKNLAEFWREILEKCVNAELVKKSPFSRNPTVYSRVHKCCVS